MAVNPKNQAEAIFDIFDDIGESENWFGEPAGVGSKQVSEFLAQNPFVREITVRINSYGGDAYEGVSIRNLLAGSGKKLTFEITGIAASAASVIATAPGTVVMYPGTQLMIHNCWTVAVGNSAELRKMADDMDKLMQTQKDAYLWKSRGKLTEDKLRELLEAETYLNPEEALQYGLADVVKIDAKNDGEDSETIEKVEPMQAVTAPQEKAPDPELAKEPEAKPAQAEKEEIKEEEKKPEEPWLFF